MSFPLVLRHLVVDLLAGCGGLTILGCEISPITASERGPPYGRASYPSRFDISSFCLSDATPFSRKSGSRERLEADRSSLNSVAASIYPSQQHNLNFYHTKRTLSITFFYTPLIKVCRPVDAASYPQSDSFSSQPRASFRSQLHTTPLFLFVSPRNAPERKSTQLQAALSLSVPCHLTSLRHLLAPLVSILSPVPCCRRSAV